MKARAGGLRKGVLSTLLTSKPGRIRGFPESLLLLRSAGDSKCLGTASSGSWRGLLHCRQTRPRLRVREECQQRIFSTTPNPPLAGGGSPAVGDKEGKPSIVNDESNFFLTRMIMAFEDTLGAKQDKIRDNEIEIIKRFTETIKVLDSALEIQEGDEFLAWLRDRGLPLHEVGGSAASDEDAAGGGNNMHEGHGGVRVEPTWKAEEQQVARKGEIAEFLLATEDKLDELAASGELLFRDSMGERDLAGKELYKAHLGAHQCLLYSCLEGLRENLDKGQLKPGLTVAEVVRTVQGVYLASPDDRLGAMFPLFDLHGTGQLDEESVSHAVDTVTVPIVAAVERLYEVGPRAALGKKGGVPMPRVMKWALWDILEVPLKKRCCFAWAEGRQQVGPTDFHVSWENYASSRREHYPELEKTAAMYMGEYLRQRIDWHNRRKGRKRAAVYGATLFAAVVAADWACQVT